MAFRPFLLYAYPWMPYPRRVIIYLREKRVPSSLVTVVAVSDPQDGNKVSPRFPPKPEGSLPILAIPSSAHSGGSPPGYIYIRQSLAIMNYLDDLCDAGEEGFPRSSYSVRGTDALGRARNLEVMAVADECLAIWNPVRLFGSGLGSMSIPEASKESARWVHRQLSTLEGWWKDRDMSMMSSVGQGESGQITMAEIVLYAFLELTNDVYGRDMTRETMESTKDVYGRDAIKQYPKLAEFYDAFKTRGSAKRDPAAGEEVSEVIKVKGREWADGSL